ncbi:3',5'-cyclic-AMP phosphodiesterase [Halioglobus maricola]|uniref:3',5'-cyclic-AMP phosphodiesterase n=1 Tax=Halioglobus maricola TaxID=2601894 RepID=A0A5P9NES3_9GAMM|nr:3',5'-cyclic-AMP phosphodiesterase [Halioglobus maricola]QFU74230.1 3',5'-cyclic-AMP phosphodiesterase [Halioglobus maricola]
MTNPVSIANVQPATDVVRVVQLTDVHLCQQRGGTLLGMNTDESLQTVIRKVLRERDQIDLVLGTGDLSDRGALEAYERLETYFEALPAPHFWLPGNHDDRGQMLAAARSDDRLIGEIRAGNWQILMLDSQIPREVGGRLGAAELARLEQALGRAESAGLHSLLCLHHQPVSIGSAWIDQQMVEDAAAFWALIERFNCVRGVLWGHVHQEIEQERGPVRLMASPSTCVQFAPESVEFQADGMPPGYRWLDLHSDGRIDSAVSRIEEELYVDLESDGYLD